jgi:tRNA(Ile)-lysidine synthase
MELQKAFINFVTQQQLFTKNSALLVATSGGVDSMVLCQLLQTNGFNFAIAHCNFNLRGAESDADADFVKQYAVANNVTFYYQQFNTTDYAQQNKIGIEEAARNLRYNWFAALTQQYNFTAILTAHHANDQVETVTMNFFRGTGLNGLRGIKVKRENIIRPLLFATKADINEYAQKNNIAYVTDSSNQSNQYTRNLFRNEILPLIEKAYPNAFENILQNATRFTEVEAFLQQALQKQQAKLITKKGPEEMVPVLLLQQQPNPTHFLWEWLQPKGFTTGQLNDIVNLLTAETGKYITSTTHQLYKNRNWLVVATLQTQAAEFIVIEKETTSIPYANQHLQISEQLYNSGDILPSHAQLNAGKIEYPLILRKCKTGDYFYPLGMPHKQKLSKFFSNNKLSLTQKQNIWIIESNKKIVWVVGMRIDDRFKAKEGQQVLFLKTTETKALW